ncbi:TPA: hypothetical protein I8010_000303 [Legionella pneumophila]|nr:hypothetical protein [Legionella pneumophila]HAT1992411.1 hypothetical protein [Legionella pneumophila]HAT2050157.1 hypothetical protein [Legionella pneumophila]HAT2058996.1 hypothetical protein [Legionella pneumophila]HAT4433967.1 hypothetical protein [Legionella pneumophila]
MSDVTPIFTSKSGYTYLVQDLIDCMRSKRYFYDFKFKRERSDCFDKPFTVNEINKILSIEEVFSAYRDSMDKNSGLFLQESAKIQGDTLELMENLSNAFEQGAREAGETSRFLISTDDFNNKVIVHVNALYCHLEKHPLEKKALKTISKEMRHDYNFVSYLRMIINDNFCASGFPEQLSAMLSLVLSLKLYMHHEEQRMVLDTNEQETIKEKAFFDMKPMTNYFSIKIEGFTVRHPKNEETLKKLIEYLDSLCIDYNDIPTISINDNQITIHTKEDRVFKTYLREKVFNEGLEVDTENICGRYKFIVSNVKDIENKLSDRRLKEREGIMKPLSGI